MLKVLTTSILMALPAIESFAYTPEDRAAGGAICKLAQTAERAEELLGLTNL